LGWRDSDNSSFGLTSDNEEEDEELTLVENNAIRAKKRTTSHQEALTEARKQQALAMSGAKKSSKSVKGKKGTGKKFEIDGKDEKDPSDPLDGIDLDGLMAEAMAGSKRSSLHSLCWWRVVLDEAHFIKVRETWACDWIDFPATHVYVSLSLDLVKLQLQLSHWLAFTDGAYLGLRFRTELVNCIPWLDFYESNPWHIISVVRKAADAKVFITVCSMVHVSIVVIIRFPILLILTNMCLLLSKEMVIQVMAEGPCSL
jgi:hypothetical protein